MNDPTQQHLERTNYPGLLSALRDADAVAVDLVQTVQGQLLVRSEDIDFLTRRLRQLVLGCLRAAAEEGAP